MPKLGYCIPCGEEHKDTDATMLVDGDPMCDAHGRLARTYHVSQGDPYDVVVTRKDTGERLRSPETCKRGCGKPVHRGNCKGQRNGGLQKGTTIVAVVGNKRTREKLAKRGTSQFGQIAARLAEAGIGSPQSDADLDEIVALAPPIDLPPITLLQSQRTEVKVNVSLVRMEDIPTVCRYRSPAGRMGEIWERILTAPPESPVVKIESASIKLACSMMSQLLDKGKKSAKKINRKRDGKVVYAWLVRT